MEICIYNPAEIHVDKIFGGNSQHNVAPNSEQLHDLIK